MEAALEAAGGDHDRALAAAQRARRARPPGGEDDVSAEWRSRRDQLITEMAEAWQRPLAAMGLLQPSHSAPRAYMGLQASPSVPLLDIELAASLPSQLVPMAALPPDHALHGRSFFHSPASPSPPRTAGARVAYGSPSGSRYGDHAQTRRHATALQPQPRNTAAPQALRPPALSPVACNFSPQPQSPTRPRPRPRPRPRLLTRDVARSPYDPALGGSASSPSLATKPSAHAALPLLFATAPPPTQVPRHAPRLSSTLIQPPPRPHTPHHSPVRDDLGRW